MKQKINHLFLMLLTLTLTISLTACGSEDSDNTSPETSTNETTPPISNEVNTTNTETNTETKTETNTPATPVKSESMTEKFKGMPDWAKELGFTEPKGMAFDDQFSQISEYDKGDKTIDSILLIYSGEYETAKAQAKVVADALKIPVTNAGLEESIGVAFTGGDEEFLINIEASPQGKLVLSASNTKQRNELNK